MFNVVLYHQFENNSTSKYKQFLTIKCAFHFYGIIREEGLLCNDWYSGCNLMLDNPLTWSEIPLPQHVFTIFDVTESVLLLVLIYLSKTLNYFDFSKRIINNIKTTKILHFLVTQGFYSLSQVKASSPISRD